MQTGTEMSSSPSNASTAATKKIIRQKITFQHFCHESRIVEDDLTRERERERERDRERD
jgi:hypothetical protein